MPALMEQCQSLGIGMRSHFPGFISTQDGLAEVYRLGTFFATASEIETQGLVLLEAAASGLPIIAARATCVPEIVRHGLNGYLAEPGDVEGLGRAMARVLSSPAEANAMGRQIILRRA
jgi:glycosyltransferase involved in cell wall biosynthesis